MPLIYAGIDEAGYGPLLGPLCVGASVFRIEDWSEGEQAPNLWKLLSTSVCRSPTDKRRRIAVDDSKALKLPNDSPKHHPLTHLERGVLTFLNVLAREDGAAVGHPAHDLDLFSRLGAGVPEEPQDRREQGGGDGGRAGRAPVDDLGAVGDGRRRAE